MGQQGFDWKYLYFSFEGRINRSTWWLKFWLPVMLINMVANLIDYATGNLTDASGNYSYGVVGPIVGVLLIYSAFAVYVKRAHDRGRTGWFVLLLFVPILNLWPAVELLFLRGTVGPNRFGPDPD